MNNGETDNEAGDGEGSRLPSGTDSLEMQLRRALKDAVARGHVEVTLSLERSSGDSFALNHELVAGYIAAFRAAASEFSLAADPDLNAVLRIPGALESANDAADGEIEAAVMAKAGEALTRLNQMREEEGRGIERELRQRMAHLLEAGRSVQQHRRAVLQNYSERLQSRIQELIGTIVDKERVLQEAEPFGGIGGIQRQVGAAGLQDAEQGGDGVGGPFQEDGDAVFGAKAGVAQSAGNVLGALVKVRVGVLVGLGVVVWYTTQHSQEHAAQTQALLELVRRLKP